MPVIILTLLSRAGIPQRFAKAAAWIIAGLLVLALLWGAVAAFRGWIADGKEQAVAIDRSDVTIEAANRVINATAEADANQMARDDAFQNDQEELQREVDTKGTDDRAGPATIGVLQRVREQQAAGRRNSGAAR